MQCATDEYTIRYLLNPYKKRMKQNLLDKALDILQNKLLD